MERNVRLATSTAGHLDRIPAVANLFLLEYRSVTNMPMPARRGRGPSPEQTPIACPFTVTARKD
jgi:hypothetical protein